MLIRAICLVVLSAAAVAQFPEAREAQTLGRSQDDALYAAFTKGYSLAPSPPVEIAEIITEFRRAVLLARERAQVGDVGFTERDLILAMTPHLGQIGFSVQARLNPMHTYAKAPAYELYLETGPNTPPLASKTVKRDPVYALGPMGSPLIGVRLEITLPRDQILAAAKPELILTDENAFVLWRARVDLSRFR